MKPNESSVDILLRELIPIIETHGFTVTKVPYKSPGKYAPPDESVLLECKRGRKRTWCAVERYGDRCVGKAYSTKTRPASTDTKGYISIPMEMDDAGLATDACDALAHEADGVVRGHGD